MLVTITYLRVSSTHHILGNKCWCGAPEAFDTLDSHSVLVKLVHAEITIQTNMVCEDWGCFTRVSFICAGSFYLALVDVHVFPLFTQPWLMFMYCSLVCTVPSLG